MKYVGKYSLSFFVKLLLVLLMVATFAFIVILPWVVEKYLELDYGSIFQAACLVRAKTILLIVLYPVGICALLVENELRSMFKTLEEKDPFVERNVKSLNRMGFLMLIVFAFFIFKIFTLNTIMTMLCAFAIILVAVLCFVLADVFRQAVIFKQENDLTI